MAVKIDVSYSQKVIATCDLKTAFDYCADPEKSVPPNFPGLEAFERVEAEVYRWVFKKLSYSGMDLQIKLVTKYHASEPAKITLSPVQSPGTTPGRFTGEWNFKEEKDETHLTFAVKLETELPIPFFLKSVAAPIAQKEIAKLFDRYLANVAKALSK